MMQQHAATKRQCERERMVGDLGRAVIRAIADGDASPCRFGTIDAVITDAHPDHNLQPRKAGHLCRREEVPEQHQPVGTRAIGIIQVGELSDIAANNLNLWPEQFALKSRIRKRRSE